ncbi:hypothetical protein JL720_5418 [Aureococcus anophagefferens]|nr:hypothetical protein JL720_5418 [Aureococcus anophagefferens]
MDASWFWVPDDAEGFVAARLVSRNKRDNLVCVSRDGRTLDPAPASACYAIDDVASVDEPPPCDLVLLAEAIDGLYGPAALAHYGGGAGALAPHVYDVAAAAYRGVRGGDAVRRAVAVAVISGESGAGKTETTKHALAYLAFVAGSPGGVQERILAASPILEALGNAKTSRNDNSSRLCGSSRFGKFMELRFDASGAIASCGNTLPPRKRPRRRPGARERNFHAALPAPQAPRHASRHRPGGFFYCGLPGDGRGGFDVAGADDAAAFVETRRRRGPPASTPRRRPAQNRRAVLHLGDASFRDSDGPEDGSAADAPGRTRWSARSRARRGRRRATLRTAEVKTGRRCSVTKRLFNRTVFDEEMALYEAEGVGQCVRLDYVDNADVLALLGGRRPPGVTLVARCGAIEAGVAEAEGSDFRRRASQGAGPGDSATTAGPSRRGARARRDVKRSLDLGLRDRDEDRLTAALGALDELRSDGKLAAGLWADDEPAAARAAEIVEQQRALVAEFQSAFASGDGAALASAVKAPTRPRGRGPFPRRRGDALAARRTLLELRDFDARGAWDDAARLAGDDGAWAVGAWAAAVEGELPPRCC